MLLIKNPAGANEIVRTLVDGRAAARRRGRAERRASPTAATSRGSGTSTSSRCSPGLDALVASGSRAAELALRFAYGGTCRATGSRSSAGSPAALDRGLELTPPGGELAVLPTYTAMLALRRIVAARGHVANYWERAA